MKSITKSRQCKITIAYNKFQKPEAPDLFSLWKTPWIIFNGSRLNNVPRQLANWQDIKAAFGMKGLSWYPCEKCENTTRTIRTRCSRYRAVSRTGTPGYAKPQWRLAVYHVNLQQRSFVSSQDEIQQNTIWTADKRMSHCMKATHGHELWRKLSAERWQRGSANAQARHRWTSLTWLLIQHRGTANARRPWKIMGIIQTKRYLTEYFKPWEGLSGAWAGTYWECERLPDG